MSTEGLEQCSGGTWRPSGLKDVQRWVGVSVQCRDKATGKAWPAQTGQMCETCAPACVADEGAPGPAPVTPMPGPAPGHEGSSSFCIPLPGGGGVTMYMDTFRWTLLSRDATCLTFLVSGLTLDTPWKFLLACVGAMLLGVSIEFVNVVRRRFDKAGSNCGSACYMRYLLQAAILVLAYVIMLIVMTYSLELFLCTILGLSLGPLLAAALAPRDPRSSSGEPLIEGAGAEEVSMEPAHPGSGGGAPCCRLAHGLDTHEAV